MRKIWILGLLLAAGACAFFFYQGAGAQAEKQKPPADQVEENAKLPKHWEKLQLTEVQLNHVDRVRAKLALEIEQLERKIRQVRLSEEKLLREILTDDQVEKLEKIEAGKLKPLAVNKKNVDDERAKRQTGAR
jgi:hypothetical protein